MKNEQNPTSKISLVTIIFFIIFFGFVSIFLIAFFFFGGNQRGFFHDQTNLESQKQNYYLGGQLPLYLGQETKRKVYLYFWNRDQQDLVSEEREIVKQLDPISEIRETLLELFLGSRAGLVSPIPPDTRLREVYVDLYQTLYVDVTRELIDNHPGGVHEEIFTILAIIKTLRENFPQISRLQILVEGKEVDTIAGHIMVNRSLTGQEFVLNTP
ncbi:GerMN domain-containing protein [candidate division CSSED10-310 bacterium]|uniref:GerMN domain-containing protein n=1 Tax=candidate division CSSED10-310 bacterium TaxID=2855610 RepID=A0ABV6YZD7_UNCC1